MIEKIFHNPHDEKMIAVLLTKDYQQQLNDCFKHNKCISTDTVADIAYKCAEELFETGYEVDANRFFVLNSGELAVLAYVLADEDEDEYEDEYEDENEYEDEDERDYENTDEKSEGNKVSSVSLCYKIISDFDGLAKACKYIPGSLIKESVLRKANNKYEILFVSNNSGIMIKGILSEMKVRFENIPERCYKSIKDEHHEGILINQNAIEIMKTMC